MSPRLIGVDGCSAGWLCIEKAGEEINAWIAPDITAVVARMESDAMVGIDIPIGLPSSGSRQCDLRARRLLGQPRGSSVFPAPIRPILMIDDYAAACEAHRAIDGRAVTKQCFHLLPKIREVDSLLREQVRLRGSVREVHPEVSFALWNDGTAMSHKKKSLAGKRERAALIQTVWPDLVSNIISKLPRTAYALDDLHDAIAALWSVERHDANKARGFPEIAEHDEHGIPMQIVA